MFDPPARIVAPIRAAGSLRAVVERPGCVMCTPHAAEDTRDLVEDPRSGQGYAGPLPMAPQCGRRCDGRRLVRADLLTCCGKRPYGPRFIGNTEVISMTPRAREPAPTSSNQAP
jgi:hypothetical protein